MKPSFLNPMQVGDLEFWLGFANDENCLFAYVKADPCGEKVRLLIGEVPSRTPWT
jgi:hypothetical protein